MSGVFYIYNFKDSAWKNIGRSIIRLNDSLKDDNTFSSRLGQFYI